MTEFENKVNVLSAQFFFPLSAVDLVDIKGFIYLKAMFSSSKITADEMKTVIHRSVLDKVSEPNDVINRVLREAAK